MARIDHAAMHREFLSGYHRGYARGVAMGIRFVASLYGWETPRG